MNTRELEQIKAHRRYMHDELELIERYCTDYQSPAGLERCRDIALTLGFMSLDEVALVARFTARVRVALHTEMFLAALAGFVARLLKGRLEYGPLDLSANRTNWAFEIAEEFADCAVYAQIIAANGELSPPQPSGQEIAGLVLVGEKTDIAKLAGKVMDSELIGLCIGSSKATSSFTASSWSCPYCNRSFSTPLRPLDDGSALMPSHLSA